MKKFLCAVIIIIFLLFSLNHVHSPEGRVRDSDWIKYARIATPYDIHLNTFWEDYIRRAVDSGANVILDWWLVSDGYTGLLNYRESIEEARKRVSYIKKYYPWLRYIVYMGPLELQTYNADMNRDGKPDKGVHTVLTDHPDWIQVGFSGKKAVFYGVDDSLPFWVQKTSEDAWVCPNNPQYRRLIRDVFTLLAETGIDGIWLDVPFLRSDFGENFKNEWACTCKFCREKFEEEEGVPFPDKVDWDNENFKRYIQFRYKETEEFIEFVNDTIKRVNPDIKLIVETPAAFTPFSTKCASNPADYKNISDLTVHELGGPVKNSQLFSRLYFLSYMDFYSNVDKRPAWLLSYVFKKYKGFKDLYKLHGAEIVLFEMNPLTSGYEGMDCVVDENFRRVLFKWMEKYKRDVFGFIKNYSKVCVVFSRKTLDFIDRGEYMSEYAYHDMFPGMLMLLNYLGIPHVVLTEEEIKDIDRYDVAIFPSFLCVSEREKEIIEDFVKNGGKAIFTGYSSLFDEYGNKLNDFRLKDLFGVNFTKIDERVYRNKYGEGEVIYIPWTPEGDFIYTVSPWYPELKVDLKKVQRIGEEFLEDTGIHKLTDFITVESDGIVIPALFKRGSVYSLRLLNFTGISQENSVPRRINVKIRFKLDEGMKVKKVTFLPYLGDKKEFSFKTLNGFLIIEAPLLYLDIFTIYTFK